MDESLAREDQKTGNVAKSHPTPSFFKKTNWWIIKDNSKQKDYIDKENPIVHKFYYVTSILICYLQIYVQCIDLLPLKICDLELDLSRSLKLKCDRAVGRHIYPSCQSAMLSYPPMVLLSEI